METINPEFVRHSDNTVEPFEPERITRSLFRVAERLGPADAFLTRELTESIAHFLEAGATSGTITSSEIADTVSRVVRELGHPALAKAYEERGLRTETVTISEPLPDVNRLARRHAAGRAADIAFSLKHIFPRELSAAHEEGLITIHGLAAPMELSGMVAEQDDSWQNRLTHIGEYLADDRLDWPSEERGHPAGSARDYFESLVELALSGDVLVSGHFRVPDGNSSRSGTGDLFPSHPRPTPEFLRDFQRSLATHRHHSVGCYWHLSATTPEDQLEWIGLPEAKWTNAEFVFDHPKRPVWLGPGLSRESKASLIRVGINLERLTEMLGEWPVDVPKLLSKAAALARFAKTAGHVKQDWLRKNGDERLRKAFLLDRATVVIVPRGLDRIISRHGLLASDLPRQLLAVIRTAVETDRPRQIPTIIDSDWEKSEPLATLSAGANRHDWKSAGALCQAINGGRIDCRLDDDTNDRFELLKHAARAGIHRLRFVA